MAITFENEKILFDDKYRTAKEIDCFLPVHLTIGGKENDLYKKDGSHNEQYYKWQFLYCFVSAGLCSKDFIGVEVSFPKGNKNSASIKLDAAIFDNKDWFEHYSALHTKKDDSKWDELNWLKEHLICGIEFKKEGSKDIKGVFNSQLKAYMNESSKETVFGILYDEGRLYLFKGIGKQYLRLSDEFNIENKGKIDATYDVPDPYVNLLSFDGMLKYNSIASQLTDYSGRHLIDLGIISKTDSRKLNDALYQILHTMDKCGLVNQKGYNILIQLLALKIYDEKHNDGDLKFYINPDEMNYTALTDDGIQDFLNRLEKLREDAKTAYIKILSENYFNNANANQVKVAIQIVKQFQNYSFTHSERNNLYQLVFYKFASQFSKADNAQFITPLQIIDFIVDIVNPKHNESIIDPTVGIADFLSVSYVKSDGKLDDTIHQYADNTMKKRRGSKSPTIDFCFKDWTTDNSYFGAEAKNLYESRPDKITRYVSTGVNNYTKGRYGLQSSESSIIGYVLSGKIPDIASELKAEMAKETPIANLARTTSSNPQYKSCHLRTFDNQEITLHHLFFDFVSA